MRDPKDTPAPEGGERRRLISPVLSVDEFQPLSALVKVEVGAHSRPGRGRLAGEDHFLILRLARSQHVMASSLQAVDLPGPFEEYGYAMVVADGAGDLGSGALASRVAISTLAHLAIHSGKWNLRVDPDTALAIAAQAEWLYQRTAKAVEQRGLADPFLEGMRTTLTVTFSAGDDLFYAHVGNSRAYLFRNGELIRLTREPGSDRQTTNRLGPTSLGPRNVRDLLGDAIGGGSALPPIDVERIHLLDNDIVLLCTDGLTRAVDEDTIADCLAHPRAMKQQCRELIDLATSRDADEDATVVLARYWIPALRGSRH